MFVVYTMIAGSIAFFTSMDIQTVSMKKCKNAKVQVRFKSVDAGIK